MRTKLGGLIWVWPWIAFSQSPVPITPAPPASAPSATAAAQAVPLPAIQAPAQNLLSVRRIYVAELTGGVAADALRELIIASLDGTRLFRLTDDPERADAILKGAADDRVFTDSFDSDKGLSDRTNGGAYTSGSKTNKLGGYGGLSLDDRESHHSRERKHEAYASVRLCSRDGDVLWSTTQESLGAKFRGASADVAMKIARQMLADYEAARTVRRQ